MTEIGWSRSWRYDKTGDDENRVLVKALKAHLLVERYSWLKRKGKTPERYATPEPIHVRQPCRGGITTRLEID